MGSDAEGSAFVGGSDESEEQLGAGVVQWCESEFVDDDQVVAQQPVDDLSDAVVGHTAVEAVEELGGGVVADPVTGVDGS